MPITQKGEFRCILYDEESTMNVVHDTGWFDNTILDSGLDVIGEHDLGIIAVGDSGIAVNPATQTNLQSWLGYAASAGVSNGDRAVNNSSPYEYSEIMSRRFGAGNSTGTIAEAAIGWSSQSIDPTYNRQLVTPAFSKSAIQVLDVLFRHTIYPYIGADVLADFTIDGNLYHTTTRSCNLLSHFGAGDPYDICKASNQGWSTWDGVIGTVEGTPLGDTGNNNTGSGKLAYIPGTYYCDVYANADLAYFNAPLGIRSQQWGTSRGMFQTEFQCAAGQSIPEFSRIPKDNTKIYSFTGRFTWAKH